MKKLSLILTIALAVSALQACNTKKTGSTGDSTSTASTSTDSSAKMTDTSKGAVTTSSAAVDKDDAKFVNEAANGGMAEVEMGKMAQQKGVSSRVKSFGSMMVTDHSKANEELMAIAKRKNIALPTAVEGDAKADMDKMMKMSGKDFDKDYVNGMFNDHQKDVKKFEDASKSLKDPDLKAFAIKTLPVLRTHLDSITAIKMSMK